jgi:hypothetical protein
MLRVPYQTRLIDPAGAYRRYRRCFEKRKMVEQTRPAVSAERAPTALFDFDGTLSPIRAGWTDVMLPMTGMQTR